MSVWCAEKEEEEGSLAGLAVRVKSSARLNGASAGSGQT